MTDRDRKDIVKALRGLAWWGSSLQEDAADEIERLRESLKEAHDFIREEIPHLIKVGKA